MKSGSISLMKSVLALLACCAAGVHGANLQISPVTLTLRAAQSAAAINLQNQGDQPMYGQVRVFAWDQRDGEEVLAPTQELVASPPIVEIAANSRQAIRLVRAQAGPVAQEKTYRVLIDEVSRDDDPGRSGVDIRLRYSVPVFVLPAGAQGKEMLDWHVFRERGEWMLRVKNSGNVHAQIGAMTFTNQAGKEFVISKGLFGYVLAARMRVWRLPVAREAELDGPLSIAVNVNAKALVATNSTP
jgi:fimbrial chaperone protein